jgi:hypothetical protein
VGSAVEVHGIGAVVVCVHSSVMVKATAYCVRGRGFESGVGLNQKEFFLLCFYKTSLYF